jgi:WD40 repeat protein
MEKAIAGFPEGKLALSKWREGFLSRGVVREQLDTRGFLTYLAERERQGVKSLAKTEVIAWLAANPYGLLETWKGDFGVKTAVEQRANQERMAAMREAKPLLIAHGLSSAEADLLLAQEEGLAVSMGNDIVRWDWALPQGGATNVVTFSPDGRTLATGTEGGKVTLWRVSDGEKQSEFSCSSASLSIGSVAFSPDGRTLAAASYDVVGLWQLSNSNHTSHRMNLPRPSSWALKVVAFSPDGRILAVGGEDLVLWRMSDQVQIADLPTSRPITSVAFSPDGRILAVGDVGNTVTLWRVSDATKLIKLFPGNADFDEDDLYATHAYVASVSFSPDGRILATGGSNGAVLWRVSDGEKLATLSAGSFVASVSFSPDGRILATGGSNGPELWRVSDGAKLVTLPHAIQLKSIAFSPNRIGYTLATGDYANKAMLWQIVPNTEPLARALLPRLSAALGSHRRAPTRATAYGSASASTSATGSAGASGSASCTSPAISSASCTPPAISSASSSSIVSSSTASRARSSAIVASSAASECSSS